MFLSGRESSIGSRRFHPTSRFEIPGKTAAGWIALVFLLLASAGSATTPTYTYTGPHFTAVHGTSYTTSMRVTGFFTTSSPLPPDMAFQDISSLVTSYSFSDGFDNIRSTDPDTFIWEGFFYVATDCNGDIVIPPSDPSSSFAIGVVHWPNGIGAGKPFNQIWLQPDTGLAGDSGAYNIPCDPRAVGVTGSFCPLVDPATSAAGYSGSPAGSWSESVLPSSSCSGPPPACPAGGSRQCVIPVPAGIDARSTGKKRTD